MSYFHLNTSKIFKLNLTFSLLSLSPLLLYTSSPLFSSSAGGWPQGWARRRAAVLPHPAPHGSGRSGGRSPAPYGLGSTGGGRRRTDPPSPMVGAAGPDGATPMGGWWWGWRERTAWRRRAVGGGSRRRDFFSDYIFLFWIFIFACGSHKHPDMKIAIFSDLFSYTGRSTTCENWI